MVRGLIHAVYWIPQETTRPLVALGAVATVPIKPPPFARVVLALACLREDRQGLCGDNEAAWSPTSGL